MPSGDDALRALRAIREPGVSRSRREFLIALGAAGLGAAAVACTGSGSPKPTPSGSSAAPNSIIGLVDGNEQLSLFSGGGEADAPLLPGKQLFGFALTTKAGSLLTGGTPQVYIAKDQTSPATGPVPATWYPFEGYDATHDTSPRSPIAQGLYSATIDFPDTGNWYVAAVAQGGSGQTAVGVGAVAVAPTAPNAPGSKATSVKTPVATSGTALQQACTRTPPCHLHAISLDAALKNGKPTVVSFSTPALCQSELCGPVTDEQILVSEKQGGKANFIHVEEFLRGPDLKYPAATAPNRSPGFKAWHLLSEPWIFVIDRKGVISARLGPGPVVAPQIEEELKKVL
jgi:hypothetical protein